MWQSEANKHFNPGETIFARSQYKKHLEFFRAGKDYRERCAAARTILNDCDVLSGDPLRVRNTGPSSPTAWAQLVVLFRMIHDGAESGAMRLPKRHGVLFDPDRFKFLEGRSAGGAGQPQGRRHLIRPFNPPYPAETPPA